MSTSAALMLAGDSTHSEIFNHILRRSKEGVWPYAPVLLLPGGTANVITVELFGNASCTEIIQNSLQKSRKGSLIKVTSSSVPEEVRYAIHTAFDGLQRHMIDTMEVSRPTIYPAFGEVGIMAIVLGSVMFARRGSMPAILSSFKSESIDNRGFGTTRFDEKIAVVYVKDYPGPFRALSFCIQMATGALAQMWKEKRLPPNIHVDCVSKFSVQGDRFTIYCDGSNSTPLYAEKEVTFEVIRNAIPYFVKNN